MIGVGLGVALPHLDRMGHQLAHGGLEIIVAHHAAGDARGAGRDRRLVDDDDVGARALAGRFQHLGQMKGGAEAVDAGADNGVFGRLRDAHAGTPRQKLVRLWSLLVDPIEEIGHIASSNLALSISARRWNDCKPIFVDGSKAGPIRVRRCVTMSEQRIPLSGTCSGAARQAEPRAARHLGLSPARHRDRRL